MLKTPEYNRVYTAAQINIEALPQNQRTSNIIAKIVDEAIKYTRAKNFQYRDQIIKHVTTNFTVKSTKSTILHHSDNHEAWYFKEELLNRNYWESYRDYLKTDKQYSVTGVNDIDSTTDKIMSLIEKPSRKGFWDVRGLVVGSVQSGKTSNFIGLINKAADAGYKGFIVLSGLHNNLRQQTQVRLDHGFLGYETTESTYYSQHKLPLWKKSQRQKENVITPLSLTNAKIDGDYKKKAAEYNKLIQEGIPTMLVIKKNKTILKNVIKHFLEAPGLAHSKCIYAKNKNGKEIDPLKIVSSTSNSYPFIRDYPILVIDDEVDNASVDTDLQEFDLEGGREVPDEEYNPRTINRLIRQFLNIFGKKAYVGYSATPFANIFIHHEGKTKEHGDDLFPRNFIIDLPVPENHTGLEKVFAEKDEDLEEDNEVETNEIERNMFCELIKDSSTDPEDFYCTTGWLPPSHDKNHIPRMEDKKENIPYSLKEALYSYILTSLVRNIRGEYLEHKTMLIHVTRFTDVQIEVKKLIIKELEHIRNSIVNNLEDKFTILQSMKKIWNEKFNLKKFNYPNHEYPDWGKIVEEKELNWFVQNISVKSLNIKSTDDDELDYDKFKRENKRGMNAIVIGGDKLSRGLTLEGLTISYFLRSAKMPMYDTLMQMGRWFGYRGHYEDLCRIYTTKKIIKFFFQITKATKEFRSKIRLMSIQDPPAKPTEYGLCVMDSEIMAITNRTKMRHAKQMRVCFAESAHEYLTFSRKNKSIEANENLFENFLNNIGKWDKHNFSALGTTFKNSYQWQNVDSLKIVNLLKNFGHMYSETGHNARNIADYVKKMQGELKNFTVTLLGNGSFDEKTIFDKFKIKPLKRKIRNKDEPDFDSRIHFGVITNETIEGCDLTQSEFEKYKFLRNELDKQDKDNKKSKRLAIRAARSNERGALNIYPIFADFKDSKKIVYTLSVSFPNTKRPRDDASISYMVNTIYDKLESDNLQN